jgi:hypothetical protein
MRFLGFFKPWKGRTEARNLEVINGLQHVFEKWVERCKNCILPREVLRKRDRHRTFTKYRLGVIRWVHELCKRPCLYVFKGWKFSCSNNTAKFFVITMVTPFSLAENILEISILFPIVLPCAMWVNNTCKMYCDTEWWCGRMPSFRSTMLLPSSLGCDNEWWYGRITTFRRTMLLPSSASHIEGHDVKTLSLAS